MNIRYEYIFFVIFMNDVFFLFAFRARDLLLLQVLNDNELPEDLNA